MHTHEGIVSNVYSHISELDFHRDERMLLTTPLDHSAGYCARGVITQEGTVLLQDGFDAERVLETIEEERVSATFAVPTMIAELLESPQLAEHETDSLRTLIYGAAPIPTTTLKEGLEQLGEVFIQLYGLAEVPNVGTTLPKTDHTVDAGQKLDFCGQPTVMVDVRIAPIDDPADTGPLPPGEEGEILLRAPYRMVGYHDLPEKTAETLVDGWVRTGDVGMMDEDGYVYILDRDSDMIVTGGMNVYTTNVEDELIKHPDVSDIAVIGIPDDDWGEAVHAVVAAGDDVTESELRSFADERLADYKKPKSVDFVDELPTTPYGKVDKKALREPYWEEETRQVA